mgnify:CR=1 FL=1
MKKFLVILGICLIGLSSFGAEYNAASPAGNANPTEEINSSFAKAKKSNWILHRLKPTDKNKTRTIQLSKKSEKKDSTTKKETTTQNNQKENITTTKPAEKVIENENKTLAKEEKLKQQQEEERKRYRELEELTEIYQQGVALYTDNNLDESLEAFIKIPEDKRTPEIWLLMGNIFMDKDKKDDAVFMYGRAIVTDSTYYKAYYNLGNIYLNDDKFNLAIEQYKLAGKYNPNNPYVFYNLGCAYLKAGDLKKAKSSFIRALEINNKVADFHYNLAYTYKKLGKEKLAKTYLDNYNKLTGQVD